MRSDMVGLVVEQNKIWLILFLVIIGLTQCYNRNLEGKIWNEILDCRVFIHQQINLYIGYTINRLSKMIASHGTTNQSTETKFQRLGKRHTRA